MSIQILSAHVIDQIAAGEVVERPAHLVKELVENSIDAGATELEIDLDQGGRRVQIRDNGRGIVRDELKLALERHATSKIANTEDLYSLHSFGFRGEALASIAAVSRLTLISRTAEDKAFQIKSEFGLRSDVRPASGEVGTTMIIEELFTNVPARLKFLKTDSAELGQIKNTLKAMALAQPTVAFRVRAGGSLLFYWPRCADLKARAAQILEVDELYECEQQVGSTKIHIIFAPPHKVAQSSRQMWSFVQKRWVQDRTIAAAVLDSFRGTLMHGEYPIVVTDVTMDPEDVDVNIHPTKSQVKFRNSSDIFRAVIHTLRPALEKAPWITHLMRNNESEHSPNSGVQTAVENFALRAIQAEPQAYSFNGPEFAKIQYQSKNLLHEQKNDYHPLPVTGTETVSETESGTQDRPQLTVTATGTVTGQNHWSRLQVLGQAHLTYILTQSDRSLILVDQHAAHERVAFEKLMAAFRGGEVDVQNFLLPLTLQLPVDQIEGLLLLQKDLEKLGLMIESMGPETLAVNAAPSILTEKGIVKAIELLGKEVSENGGSLAFDRIVSDIVATLACHSVIRAGQALSLQEMQALLIEMDRYSFSSFCPHGRPVFVEYPFDRIEREFGRTL